MTILVVKYGHIRCSLSVIAVKYTVEAALRLPNPKFVYLDFSYWNIEVEEIEEVDLCGV